MKKKKMRMRMKMRMRKKKTEIWIDQSGMVRVREEYAENHWRVATLKPILVREMQETEP